MTRVLLLAACFLLTATAAGQPASGTLRAFLLDAASQQLAKRREDIAALRTREQIEQRQREVRQTLLRLIGGLPQERSPLKVRKIGTIDRGDYRVEKIIFESQPAFYVTASLYIPQGGTAPYPAVLHSVGHSPSAKARASYQALSIGLVKHGFVVLTYDPLSQGERGIFYDEALEGSKVGGPTVEHRMVGIQSLLAGESVARYMIWDAMRGIDLLQSLPEVDGERVGVTGCSGGGTLTTYVAVLDERVRVAAPACYITSWEEQLQGTGPQDAEQQFPDLLKEGLDHADFVEAFAPKPYLISSTKEDFFPLDGARRTFEEGKRVWSLFGAEERIAWTVGPGPHGMRAPIRGAIYAWMKRWLQDARGPAPEPQMQTEYEENLLCTRTGQIATSLGGETASSLNIRRFSKLAPERPVTDIEEKVRRLTRYRPSGDPVSITRHATTRRDGYQEESLDYAAGAGRVVPARLLVPDAGRSRNQSVLYVDAEGRLAEDADQLAQLGYTVLALDVAGRGDTAEEWESSDPWFGNDKFSWLALMVGKTMVGLRMDDILRGIDVLEERKLLHGGRCFGFGKGLATVDLLHAAVVDSRLSALTLEAGLVSYAAIARTPIHRQVFEAVVPGVLTEYDLPDLVAALAPRPVRIVNARSPLGNPLSVKEMRAAYPSGATVGLRREDEPVSEAYPALR